MVNIYKGVDKKEVARIEQDKGPREVGFFEAFSSARKEQFTVKSQFGRDLEFSKLLDQQKEIIKNNKLDIFTPGEFEMANHGRPITSEVLLNKIKDNKEKFEQIRAERPELGLKTIKELEEAQLNSFNHIMESNQKATDNTTFLGAVGSFLGSVAGYLQDPVGAATLIAPGAAVKGGMSLLQAVKAGAAAELKVAAVPIAINKPGEIKVREALGEEVTAKDIAIEVGAELATASLLGGAVAGAVSKAPAIKNSLKKAINLHDDIQHLENTKHPSLNNKEHVEQVNKAMENAIRGEEIKPPKEVNTDIKPEEIISEVDPEVISRQQVEEARKIIEETEPSIKHEFLESESDLKVFEEIDACMRRNS